MDITRVEGEVEAVEVAEPLLQGCGSLLACGKGLLQPGLAAAGEVVEHLDGAEAVAATERLFEGKGAAAVQKRRGGVGAELTGGEVNQLQSPSALKAEVVEEESLIQTGAIEVPLLNYCI